jgi:glycosyltransferase involved in cell wall biosynthesis
MSSQGAGPTLGFACHWDPHREATWSGTPWRLRQALAQRAAVVDLGVSLGRETRLAMRLAHLRRSGGRWTSGWQQSRALDLVLQRRLGRAERRTSVDAVIEVQDLATFSAPFFTYQDLSYDVLLDLIDAGVPLTHFPHLRPSNVRRRRDRQQSIYGEASGVLAMSSWFADRLVASGLPRNKIHVVRPGINTLITTQPAALDDRSVDKRSLGGPRRLLFVGRDFHSKGGDLVVAAFNEVRRDYDPELRLTIAGPPQWPLRGEVPEGVSFLGPVSRRDVARLMDQSDLFVMPSRFEGFGIVFAEALVAGLPCIGRRAFAMPEVVIDGVSGRLLEDDDFTSLASLIVECLDDDSLTASVAAGREEARAYWSWDRAAADIMGIVSRAGS